jgi:hypothetical protein
MNVTYLSKIVPSKSILKQLFELLYGWRPTLYNNLKIFGKLGVVTTKERL